MKYAAISTTFRQISHATSHQSPKKRRICTKNPFFPLYWRNIDVPLAAKLAGPQGQRQDSLRRSLGRISATLFTTQAKTFGSEDILRLCQQARSSWPYNVRAGEGERKGKVVQSTYLSYHVYRLFCQNKPSQFFQTMRIVAHCVNYG